MQRRGWTGDWFPVYHRCRWASGNLWMFRLSVESAPFGREGLKCGSEERREGQAPPLRGFKKAFRFCVGEPLGAPARIRTGSVGSAKSGAVVEPHRPQFSAQPGPGGPAGIQTLTQSLRAGNVLPTPRGNPRNGGPRGNLAWRTRRYAEVPPCKFPLASFGSFSTGKRNSPRRANPL